MEFGQDLVKGSIVPIVLALLDERPMYGYEIVKLVNARSGGRLEWKEGTLYPTLHKLQADGLLKARWADPPASSGGTSGDGEAGGRKRKYYSITGKGAAELKRRRGEWREFTSAVNGILLGSEGRP
jgi:PadR family transcriptional regulator